MINSLSLLPSLLLLSLLAVLSSRTYGYLVIDLSWTPPVQPPGIVTAGYKVYYDTSPAPPFAGTILTNGPSPIIVPIDDIPNPAVPTYSLDGVPSCQPMWIALTDYSSLAPDCSNCESLFSNLIAGQICSERPSNLTGTCDANGINLSWIGISGGASDPGTLQDYQVLYGPSPSTWTGTTATNGASPISLPFGTTYGKTVKDYAITGLTGTVFITIAGQCNDNGPCALLQSHTVLTVQNAGTAACTVTANYSPGGTTGPSSVTASVPEFTSSSSDSKPNKGIFGSLLYIIIIAIGGVLLLGVIVVVAILMVKKRRNSSSFGAATSSNTAESYSDIPVRPKRIN